jgi:hypothetical protein
MEIDGSINFWSIKNSINQIIKPEIIYKARLDFSRNLVTFFMIDWQEK